MDYTTLQQIREHSPCQDGWEKLLGSLNKTKADDEELSFKVIIDSNGLDDALWCLRVHKDECKVRAFAADCAERVLHIFEKEAPNDNRPRLAIEAARQFAKGEIDDAAMAAARAAAMAAAWDAAGDAAIAAARAAARAAAWDAAASARAAMAAEEQAQVELYIKYFC